MGNICKDFYREDVKKTRHDIQVYHTSMNAGKFCEEGFKSVSCGLGGRNCNDSVSFTSSLHYACAIKLDLQKAVQIANKKITIDNIEKN